MNRKVILITGTNSGFGWLHAHTLAAKGHAVYATMREVAGRNREKAEALRAVPGVAVLDMQVTDAGSVRAAVAEVVAKEGRIDVLINNAGHFSGGIAESFTEADLEQMLDVHVKGVWRSIREVLPHMRSQGEGLIINTSSSLGRFSAPFMTMYNTAKFAVEGMSEGLRYELRPLGIDVALIQPGAFPTEIFGKAGTGSDASVVAGYGDLARLPDQIGQGIGQLFETVKPDPQLVADAALRLIELPKGQRPLRTPVDATPLRAVVETANAHVEEGYKGFLTGFGMADLLN